ncbi:unnamed protein product [Periconia digitata]|uniref:NACHT domain-containing protein n=1 Tax=Periconia digitata TaxID=1303443 RepID=A0A9W4XRZ6_9PLEO|nr:unnamed protein product [Periconia digitata]
MAQGHKDYSAPVTPLKSSTNIELDSVFSNAKTSFLATLTPEERRSFSPCKSADELLTDIRALNHLPKARRGLPMMTKIHRFSECLSPYFKVIEIVCQSNPEWSCVAWGAFRLVLQLASNFSTFFEKLTKLIEKLTTRLPHYTEYYESVILTPKYRVSHRLSDSLMRFYVDILDFFQAVGGVFTKPCGKLKRTPVVIAELMWCPFETRFQDILERMNHHQSVLKDELQLAFMQTMQHKMDSEQKEAERARLESDLERKRAEDARLEAHRNIKLTNDIKELFSEHAQRAFRAQVVTWLAPPHFKQNFENALEAREEGTAEWLFEDPKYRRWDSMSASRSDSLSDCMLWIQGNPGWGKSVMAASTVEELESKQASNGTEPVICYYFFNEEDTAAASFARTRVYRAIASQIFQRCHGMEEIHNIYALANDGSNSVASEHELRDILSMIIPLLSEFYLVLDGLDEMCDVDKFLADLRGLCRASSAKLVMFSRPHVAPLRDILSSHQTITMIRSIMSVDIHVFVKHQIADLNERNKFPADTDLLSVENQIVERADGMFLWARLMIGYLRSPALTKSQRMSTIFKTTPIGLRQMYDRICDQIKSMDHPSQQLALTTFNWITYAQKDLTVEEYSEVVYCETQQEDLAEKKQFIDNSVIVVCCGLIEKRHDNILRFVHLTAKEHVLSEESKVMSHILSPASEAHAEIASRCLSYLLYSIPAQPLAGRLSSPASSTLLQEECPLLSYAALYWPKHTLESIESTRAYTTRPERRDEVAEMFNLIDRFLNHPGNITVWIEASYLFGNGVPLCTVLDIPSELPASSSEPTDFGEFYPTLKTLGLFKKDVEQINKHWRSILKEWPHRIWGDVSSFTKSQFLAQNQTDAIATFAPSREDHPTKQVDPIFCIASKNSSSTMIGKLTIFPSIAFEEVWRSKPVKYEENWFESFDDTRLLELCSGWSGQYQIHRIGEENETLLSEHFSLSPDEIRLQMQFSFRLSVVRAWKFKFPMAISSDLSTIIILRTFITTNPAFQRSNKQDRILTDVAKFDGSERLCRTWSKKAIMPTLSYFYEWAFSSDNSYAIFRDWDMHTSFGSLVTFRLERTYSRIQSLLVEGQELEGVTRLPLFAIHPVDLKFMTLHSHRLIFRDIRTGKEFYAHPPNPFDCSNIEFSQCGKYYVIKFGDQSHPHIFPVPWQVTEDDMSNPASPPQISLKKKRKLEHTPTDSFEMMISSANGSYNVDSSSTIVDPEANMALSISPAHTEELGYSHGIQLTRLDTESGTKSSCTLVTIPETTDPRYTKATVTLLDSERDTKRVRIVLTPEVHSTYESDVPTISSHLPAIIDRETSTLIPGPEQKYIAQ